MLLLPLLLLLLLLPGLVLVVLCACRVGHMEDVQRGFAEGGHAGRGPGRPDELVRRPHVHIAPDHD